MSNTTILDWKLIRLTLDQIGPFQEAMQSFDFVEGAPPEDEKPRPANLYMLLAKNGAGKTTILESIHGLFGRLAAPPVGRFTDLRNTGRVQADFRVRWRRDRREETVLLSMWLGSNDPLLTPDTVNLEDVTADTEWVRIALDRNVGGTFLMDGSSPAGIEIWRDIREQIGAAPTALMGASQGLPTVLFFPADRTVFPPREASGVERPLSWGYQPAQTFSADGPEWRNSIDNLLVWLDWLGDDRLEQLLEFVNPKLFLTTDKALNKPQRETLMASVTTPNGPHPLSGLSHGERALLQLFVRTACHMTRNTIVLIDEIETHLHTTWMNRMFQALKVLVGDSRLSVIFSTHNRELIEVFDHMRPEPNLAKGGYLIEDEIV